MSTTQEYYIRKASETDARGPFTLEQLSSLSENGQVDAETYYYDAATEAWAPINGNAELMQTLFPTKKVLRVRAKAANEMKTLNTVSENDRPITVNDMLLAAEGRTEDTRDKADPAIARGQAANIGSYASLTILLVTAAAYLLPHIDIVTTLDLPAILQAPLIILGVINLLLAVCIGLGAVSSYPFIRFAAMLGLGFAGTLFYFNGDTLPLAFSAAAALGLYLCTILLNIAGVIFFALLGVLGAIGLAHHFFTT
ncbi:MAG: DUF4339 domain-containing protein [Verrucomicrobia bacterium]|nr:DUF4339 domain-containing protein [Verrucomicrobiota bacterium]